MVDEKRCFGCIGFDSVRSKHAYTDSEQQLLMVFARMLVNVRIRHEMEENLLRRDSLLEAAARIGQLLLTASDPETMLDKVMQLMGEASGQDRAYYFCLHSDSSKEKIIVSLRSEWVRAGIEPQINKPYMHEIELNTMVPRIADCMLRGQSYCALVDDIQDDSKEFLKQQNIVSFMLMPMLIDGCFHGFIGLDSCQRQYQWTPGEYSAMAIIASALGTSLTRFQAEQALRESQERYRAISERSHSAICIINDQGKITWCNDQMVKMGGYPRETIFAAESFISFLAPESIDFTVGNFSRAISGQPYEHQYRFFFIRSDGSKRACDKHMMDYLDTHGRRNVIINMTDVTDRLNSDMEKARLEAQLQQAQKMESVGRLAGGVAHDFNNMLGAILGNVNLLLESLPAKSVHRENLEEIEKCAQRSTNLTRQLLAFARKQTVEPKVLDLNETVSGMLKLLRRLIGEDITLNWCPAEKTGMVKIDPSQVDQILANLCVNSRDSIKSVGKITIETANCVFDDAFCASHIGFVPGEYVMLAVSDNGCGMDKQTMASIFEPFFTTKETGKGTGLGLATVYGAVRQNGAFINVYSEPASERLLKYICQGIKAKPGQYILSRKKCRQFGHRNDSSGRRRTGYPAHDQNGSGKAGLYGSGRRNSGRGPKTGHQSQPRIDMLMTDVVMPEMNGRELARKIEKMIPGIKCLFMSGYTADVIAQHGVLEPGVNFIQKPFSLRDLAEKIRSVLES